MLIINQKKIEERGLSAELPLSKVQDLRSNVLSTDETKEETFVYNAQHLRTTAGTLVKERALGHLADTELTPALQPVSGSNGVHVPPLRI